VGEKKKNQWEGKKMSIAHSRAGGSYGADIKLALRSGIGGQVAQGRRGKVKGKDDTKSIRAD